MAKLRRRTTGLVEQLAMKVTSDSDYQMLLVHVLNHLILVPPLAAISVTLRYVIAYVQPSRGILESFEVVLLKVISLILMLLIAYVISAVFVETAVTVGRRVWRRVRS